MKRIFQGILAAGLFFAACTPINSSSESIVPNTQNWRILPLGDSNTAGGGYSNATEKQTTHYSYRGNLYNRLKAAGYSIDYVGSRQAGIYPGTTDPETTYHGNMTEDMPDKDHGGYGGFAMYGNACNFSELGDKCNLGDYLDKVLVGKPNIVLLMIGQNGDGDKPAELERLVNAIKTKLPDAAIFTGGYPNLRNNPAWQDLRDKALSLADAARKIYYVDLNNVLPNDSDFTDAVHHSKRGAEKVAARFYAALEPYLRGSSPSSGFPTSRDPKKWPFSRESIWNMPIGSGARYVDADLGVIGEIIPDIEYIYFSKASDPVQKVYLPSGGVPRADPNSTTSYVSVQIPDDFVVADATLEPFSTPNNCAAIVAPDGRTITELQPFTRPTAGGKVWAYNASIQPTPTTWESTLDIRGSGSFGSHFGSTMSTLGGSIRAGEINGLEPIRHAIKLELSTEQLWRNARNPAASFRFPARNADGDTSQYGVFNTSNSALSMGALLAIPPSVTQASLRLQTAQGRKIFEVLQNYGAYIVDTSGASDYKPNGGFPVNIAVESSVVKNEFSFSGSPSNNSAWFGDMKKMLGVVKVVDNNSPSSIGGGGTPRQPLAPPFAN